MRDDTLRAELLLTLGDMTESHYERDPETDRLVKWVREKPETIADTLLPLIREYIAKAEAERDQAKKDLRSTRSEWLATMDQFDEVHRRAEEAERQRDENLQNVRKVEDLRMAEIGQLSNTINTLRSYAEARSKSTSEAVRLTAEGVLQILDREATDGTR